MQNPRDFAHVLADLRRELPHEKPLEPELKHNRKQQDARIREEQDLRAGAIMQAVVEEGEGDARPGPNDLVYVHMTVRTDVGAVLWSTRTQERGSGQPLAFMIEKGQRAPRSWEVAVKGMRLKQVMALKVKPSYAFEHPDCAMPPPPGVPRNTTLHFEMQLVRWYSSEGGAVRPLPIADSSFKRILTDGAGWENPRPPFEVSFACTARAPAYDGEQLAGPSYFSMPDGQPIVAQMGTGALPQGLEEALSSMTVGERAVFVIPSDKMAPLPPPAAGARALLPPPPSDGAQVELELELRGLVQLRDLIGDGSAFKKRTVQGAGEFPVDCPVEDTTVRIHYRVRALELRDGAPLESALASGSSSGSGREWAFDTRSSGGDGGDGGSGDESGGGGSGRPHVEFDTGCGELPYALEMAIKLMVPGETSLVASAPAKAYGPRNDAPPGVDPNGHVLFEVELVSFERQAHWQNLEMAQRFVIAERIKAKGNELFRAKKPAWARSNYERLMRLLDSTRDYETNEEVAQMDALKLNVVSNLALACHQQEDYIQAVAYATKALDFDPDSAKLLLRRARALSAKGDFAAAAEDLATAAKAPGLPEALATEVEAETGANKRREKAAGVKQRQAFRSFFDR
ncbi:hypothetical protein FOA52_005967 [Chlamydomonas sp. UWO 241]|nr:hypothetical protein FOA52_005967 [Chlamydomonas sp. UWO 241]